MALIKINGVAIPTPSDFSVGIQDISKADRDTHGNMIIDRITTKRKIELTWKFLDQNSVKSILEAVSGVFFSVEYPDPQTGTTSTKTFYAGDRSCGMLDYKNGVPRYKDVKFNIIEK